MVSLADTTGRWYQSWVVAGIEGPFRGLIGGNACQGEYVEQGRCYGIVPTNLEAYPIYHEWLELGCL